jgi:all-trans-8'-apo-beta-carotenal 15,15'-oxygenase
MSTPAEDGRLRHAPQHYALPGVVIALIHDVVVTNDYYVIVVGPIDFSMSKFVTQYMTSRCSIAECMEYKPQEKPTTVHLVPRPGGKAGKSAEWEGHCEAHGCRNLKYVVFFNKPSGRIFY